MLVIVTITRKLCYHKDDRAMSPIYGRPENFWDSPTMPTATFPKIFHGLLFWFTLWICVQNLQSITIRFDSKWINTIHTALCMMYMHTVQVCWRQLCDGDCDGSDVATWLGHVSVCMCAKCLSVSMCTCTRCLCLWMCLVAGWRDCVKQQFTKSSEWAD